MSLVNTAAVNFIREIANNDHPRCFTKSEWSGWKQAENEAPTKPMRLFACRDCTSKYSQDMGERCVNRGMNINRIAK